MNEGPDIYKAPILHDDWEDTVKTAEDAARFLSRLITHFERTGVSILKDTSILEVGSGRGVLTKYLYDQGYDVVAIDMRPRGISNIPVAKLRAESLPFDEQDPKQCFDLVIAAALLDPEVSAYGQDIPKILNEFARILIPGGFIYIWGIHMSESEVKAAMPTSLTLLVNGSYYYILEKESQNLFPAQGAKA